jgi:hypothetical protein
MQGGMQGGMLLAGVNCESPMCLTNNLVPLPLIT